MGMIGVSSKRRCFFFRGDSMTLRETRREIWGRVSEVGNRGTRRPNCIGKSTWWCGSLESARGRAESRIAVAMAVISPMLRLVAVRDTSHQKVFDQPEQFRSKFSKEVGISVEFDGKPGAVSYSMQLPQDVAADRKSVV